MQPNVGVADRVLRSVAGPSLFLSALGPLGAGRGHLHGFVGVVASGLVTETGIGRVCPVNPVLGLERSSS